MPYTPEDNALLAQFAGQAMQALIQRDYPGNPIKHEYVVAPAFDAAELMLKEHKRRTAAADDALSIRQETLAAIVKAAVEIGQDPDGAAKAEELVRRLLVVMRSDGQERGNG